MKGMIEAHPTERRLAKAVEHVSTLWFPVDAEHLKKIQEGLKKGAYDLSLEFLVEEIKSDFALYMYTLRELTKHPRIDKKTARTPSDLLTSAEIGVLREILPVEARKISTHLLTTSNPWQLARLSEALVAATAAETLAERERMIPDLGYSGALLRQLGLTLIAWNYPTVYKRALDSLKSRDKPMLDVVLSDALGFSPLLLGSAIVEEWALPPVIEMVMCGDGNEIGTAVDSDYFTLKRFCEIGEALARANDPEFSPRASEDWIVTKQEIDRRLGGAGLIEIGKRVSEKFGHYTSNGPKALKEILQCRPEAKQYRFDEQTILKKNPFLAATPLSVKKRLKEFYESLSSEAQMKDLVRVLVREIIPLAGYTGGAIYTFDPIEDVLIPRTVIGLIEATDIFTVPIKGPGAFGNTIVAAFKSSTVISERLETPHGELTQYLARLGVESQVGVLYLERPSDTLIDDEGARAVFKAIHKALSDVLGLR